ncbi:MAG: TrmH family RNA methyltransferase [Rhodoglobus sp.]
MIDNPRARDVRAVAALARRDARSQTGLFLVEGPQVVSEALRYRPELLVGLYATPTAIERYPVIVQAASQAGIAVVLAAEAVIGVMADTVTPQGIVGVCRQFSSSVKEILAADPRLIVILEEVSDPGNAGTIIRAADAAGADAVIMTGRSVDVYNPKVVRATTGSLFHIPVAVGVELGEVIDQVSAVDVQVIAADIKGADLLSERAAGVLSRPTAWLFGNEARGLSKEDLDRADRAITVPLYGHAESMNLATAASVCLYESAFAQRS